MKTPREIVAGAAYGSFAGGTNDPTIDGMAMAIAEGMADAAIAALEAEGWRIVPEEPTDGMLGDAVWDRLKERCASTRPDSEHYDKVTKLVMVSKSDVAAALRLKIEELGRI